MAEYILKDSRGKEQTFADDKIFVQGTDGELVQFTMGTGEAVLENLEVTKNGTYTPGDGVDGFGNVVVNVPEPEVVLQDKTITENGTYSADEGFDGLGKVTVEVAGSGGGSLPAGGYWGIFEDVPRPNDYNWNFFELGGELYAFTAATTEETYTGVKYKYKMVDGAWVQLADETFIDAKMYSINPVEYNGKLHFTPKDTETTEHWTFDGTAVEQKADFPGTMYGKNSLFTQDNKLKAYCYKNGKVYVWDETTDTWNEEASIFSNYNAAYVHVINDVVYVCKGTVIYTYENGVITKHGDTKNGDETVAVGNKIYCCLRQSTNGVSLYCYDVDTKTESYVTKIPTQLNYGACYLKTHRGKLLSLPAKPSYGVILQLYEVTE